MQRFGTLRSSEPLSSAELRAGLPSVGLAPTGTPTRAARVSSRPRQPHATRCAFAAFSRACSALMAASRSGSASSSIAEAAMILAAVTSAS